MIERRFTFRGRCYQRDFYRGAWDKLVLRARILGDVPVILNDDVPVWFAAVHVIADMPTSEIRLEIRYSGAPTTKLERITLLLGDDTEIKRTLRPVAILPIWSLLRLTFIEPPPSYFRREDATA